MLQKLRLVIDQLNDRAADPRSGLNEVIQEITSQTFELLSETFARADFFVYAVMFLGDHRARLIAAAPAQIFTPLAQTIAQSETGGLTYQAFQTKKAQNVPDITLAQAEAQADIIHDPQTRAQLSLPLRLASGRVIAIISIEHHQINAFTADLQEILELLAEYAATAIQSKINLRSFDVLQSATHRLNNTLSIDVKQILDVLAEESVRVLQSLYTDVVFSHIALMRGRRLEFFVAYSGLPEEDVHQLLREKVNDVIDLDNPPQGKIGIIGRVVLNNKPQNVPDVRQDTDYIQLSARIRSQLAVPITLENKVLGVINLEHQEEAAFDLQTQHAIETLAAAAAIAIQNARLYQALQQINAQVSTNPRDVSNLLELILNNALALCGAEHGAIGLVDKRGGIEFIVRRGVERLYLAPNQGVAARVVQTGMLSNIADLSESHIPEYVRNQVDTRSDLMAPIQLEGSVIGIINIQSPRPMAFSVRAEQMLTALAGQAAAVMRNRRLVTTLAKLHEIGRELSRVRSEEELADQLWILLKQLIGILLYRELDNREFHEVDFDPSPIGAMILMVRRENEEAVDIYAFDGGLHQGKRMPVPLADLTIARSIFAGERTDYISGKRLESLPLGPSLPWLHPYASHIALPIVIKGERKGILSVHSRREDAFNQDDVETVRNICEQTTGALGHLLRIERLRRSVATLNEFDRLILRSPNAAEREKLQADIWNFVANKACELTQATQGSIFRLEGKEFIVKVEAIGAPVGHGVNTAYKLDQKDIISAVVANQRISLLIHDVQQEAWINHTVANCRSILAVPMLYGDKLLGVLTVKSDLPNAFDENDEGVLIALAGQAVVAVKYAEQIEKLRDMVDLSNRLTHVTLEEGAKIILAQALNLLDADNRQLRGSIRKLNVATNELDLLAHQGFTDAEGQAYIERYRSSPISQERRGFIGMVAESAKRLRIPDITAPQYARVQLNNPGIRSLMAVAIYGKIEPALGSQQERRVVSGVITVVSPQVDAFNESDLDLLTNFANQIGLVWLYIRQRERIHALIDISQRWSSAKTWQDLQIWAMVEKLLGAKGGTLTTLHRGTGGLQLLEGRGNYLPSTGELPLGSGIQGWVAQHARPVNIADVHDSTIMLIGRSGEQVPVTQIYYDGIAHEHKVWKSSTGTLEPHIQPTQSELTVPILSPDGAVQGVLNIESPALRAFDMDDLDFLQALANQAWSTIHSAQSRTSADDLQVINQITNRVHEGTSTLTYLLNWWRDNLHWLAPIIEERIPGGTKILSQLQQNLNEYVNELRTMKQGAFLARPQASNGGWEATSAYNMLQRVTQEYQKEHMVIIDCPNDLYVRTDGRVDQIFKNLVRNAVQHRHPQRPVHIEIGGLYIPQTHMIEFWVIDNGKGILPDLQEQIWRPGFSNKRLGIGLGLWLVKSLVEEQYGGKIVLKSDLGKGSEFRLWLPAATSDQFNLFQ